MPWRPPRRCAHCDWIVARRRSSAAAEHSEAPQAVRPGSREGNRRRFVDTDGDAVRPPAARRPLTARQTRERDTGWLDDAEPETARAPRRGDGSPSSSSSVERLAAVVSGSPRWGQQIVLLPRGAGRPGAVSPASGHGSMELLLCRHHYRACSKALSSFRVALYDDAGQLVDPDARQAVVLHEGVSR